MKKLIVLCLLVTLLMCGCSGLQSMLESLEEGQGQSSSGSDGHGHQH